MVGTKLPERGCGPKGQKLGGEDGNPRVLVLSLTKTTRPSKQSCNVTVQNGFIKRKSVQEVLRVRDFFTDHLREKNTSVVCPLFVDIPHGQVQEPYRPQSTKEVAQKRHQEGPGAQVLQQEGSTYFLHYTLNTTRCIKPTSEISAEYKRVTLRPSKPRNNVGGI